MAVTLSSAATVVYALILLIMVVLLFTGGCTVDQCHSSILSAPSNLEQCMHTRIP